jgi:hypothetical protein
MFNNSMNKLGILVAALVLSIAAMAQEKPVEQKVSFYLDGKIGTELVKKGTYTVVIPETEQGLVEIRVGKKIIKAQFTRRQNQEQAEADKMTYRDTGDGTRAIATITPRGRKFTLLLQDSVASK